MKYQMMGDNPVVPDQISILLAPFTPNPLDSVNIQLPRHILVSFIVLPKDRGRYLIAKLTTRSIRSYAIDLKRIA